jgi:hypothetical protein
MRTLEYNKLMSILFVPQPPVAPTCRVEALAKMEARQRRINSPLAKAFGVSYQPSAELLQKHSTE